MTPDPDLTPAEQTVRDALGKTNAGTYNGHVQDARARDTVAALRGQLLPTVDQLAAAYARERGNDSPDDHDVDDACDALRLLRAALDPPPPAVGDTITSVDQLDRLPVGAVVRAPHGGRAIEKFGRRCWYRAGDPDPIDLPLLIGARVLDLGEPAS